MGKTRGVHETTPEIRNRMIGMYEAGLGLREIAAAVNCSQRTVKRWLNRFDKEGTVETRERCGRKRATTKEEDEAIIQLATQTPITAAKAVLPALGLNCSVDTIRERLHRAGIHNWSLSRKHIQKIPVAISDNVGIQQAVWRPTGTQLGKKKSAKEENKTKSRNHQSKKKVTSQKNKPKNILNDDDLSNNPPPQLEEHQNFSFSPPIQSEQEQRHISDMQTMPLHPPPPPTSLPPHSEISSNQNQYCHSLNLLPQPQPHYVQPGLNISQNWPLDLVQSTHHYTQNLQNPIHSEPTTMDLQNHPHLHNHHDVQLPQNTENQMHSSLHPLQNINQQKVDHHMQPHQDLSELSQEKLNDSQDVIINVCSEVCSNSNNSSNENSQSSSIGNEMSDCDTNKKKKPARSKKKKGGKIKGTLETSVEIRNRMIGMSEAGLSTLSIALAINRSERTVKRWLDRWRKEGNVQTKERKGRKRITTKEEDDAIIELAIRQPLTAAKHVAPALGLKCSVDTIRERLHKAGIHSWIIGKKQGEGNAVNAVHLWQPSGNRYNKAKTNEDKKKKSASNKRSQTNSNKSSKKTSEKQTEKESPNKSVVSTNVVPEENHNMHYQTQAQTPEIIQATHDLNGPASIMQVQHIQQDTQVPSICSQISSSQTLQPLGPVIQRPDCRLALPTIVPPISNQVSSTVSTYPSCMMGTSAHTGHLEQTDSMNYEPYIWSF